MKKFRSKLIFSLSIRVEGFCKSQKIHCAIFTNFKIFCSRGCFFGVLDGYHLRWLFLWTKNIFLKTRKNWPSQRLPLGEINKNLIAPLFDNCPHKLSWKGEFFNFSKKLSQNRSPFTWFLTLSRGVNFQTFWKKFGSKLIFYCSIRVEGFHKSWKI